jgi:hypothetical protein
MLATRELGARLELSTAPSTWPSDCCRRMREREREKEQTTLGCWCFSEHLMEIKLVLSGNVHSLE